MSGFLYFIPGQVGGHRFAALGLGDRLGPTGREQTRVGSEQSPTGAPGVVFAAPSPGGLPHPIDWHEADGYHIGWHTPYPPGPADLHNGLDVTGFNITLLDGNAWRVPLVAVCRDLDPERECGLPQVYALADNGDARDTDRGYASTVKAEYMPLVEESEAFLAAVLDESAAGPDAVDYCAHLLHVSYRIGVAEMLALELLDKECAEAMVLGSIDFSERIKAKLTPQDRKTLIAAGEFDA